MECFLCTASKNNARLIYENDFFVSRFDAHPVTPGHVIIFSKEHVSSLFALSGEAWSSLQIALQETKKAVESTDMEVTYRSLLQEYTGQNKAEQYITAILASSLLKKTPDGYTIGINEGEAAGQTISHLHLHLIPRFHGDVADPRGGVRGVIPSLGNYKK